MCKILFLGTKSKIEAIGFNPDHPAFWIKEIDKSKTIIPNDFESPYIYLAYTRRHCACDFSININLPIDENSFFVPPIQKLINIFRKATGSYDTWKTKINARIEEDNIQRKGFLADTKKLLGVVSRKVEEDGMVELFCARANDEELIIANTSSLKIQKDKIESILDFEEGDFIRVYK